MALVAACFAGCSSSHSTAARASYAQQKKWEKTLAKAAKENKPMLITPLVGVGPVKFGMNFEEVKNVLGEPDLMVGNCPQYRFGFSLVPKRGENKVEAIMAGGPCKGDDLLVEAFKGVTKEGIGMSATREQIVAAFGPPTSSEDRSQDGEPQVEYLRYDELGMELTLRWGRLVHFALKPSGGLASTNAPAGK